MKEPQRLLWVQQSLRHRMKGRKCFNARHRVKHNCDWRWRVGLLVMVVMMHVAVSLPRLAIEVLMSG